MPSFAKITSFAALAFGALVSAVPLGVVDGVADKVLSAVPAVPVLPAIVPGIPRDVAPVCIEGILVDLTVKLTPIVDEIFYIVAGNATKEVLAPIVGDIQVAIQDSIYSLQGLVGKPVDDILVTANGTVKLTLGDVAHLLAGVITIVLGALGHVLSLAKIDIAAFIKIFVPVGEILGTLLALVVSLVGAVLGDITGAVLPLIGSVVHVIVRLNVSVLIRIFAL